MEQLLKDFPFLENEDILEAIAFAASSMDATYLPLLVRRKLAATVESFPLNDDIAEEEVRAEVESVRAARHAGKSI